MKQLMFNWKSQIVLTGKALQLLQIQSFQSYQLHQIFNGIVYKASVFARFKPQQKADIIKQLKQLRLKVGMTGAVLFLFCFLPAFRQGGSSHSSPRRGDSLLAEV